MIVDSKTSIANAQCGFAGHLFKIKKEMLVRDSRFYMDSQTNQLSQSRKKENLNYEF